MNTDRIGQIKTEIKIRNEQLAAQASERNNGILTPVAELAHHKAVHALHVELIGLIEGSTAPAPASAPVKAIAPAPAPKATTAKVETKAAVKVETTTTKAETSEATVRLKPETVKALDAYNAIDPDDAAGREAFRRANAKALGL